MSKLEWIAWLGILLLGAWITGGCCFERLPKGESKARPKFKAVCLEYAGAESDKPFFPIAITTVNDSRQAVLRCFKSVRRLNPIVFVVTDTEMDSLIESIKAGVISAPVAKNADFGDFEIEIVHPVVKIRKTVSRKIILEVLQGMDHEVLQNNPHLHAQLLDLAKRLSQ